MKFCYKGNEPDGLRQYRESHPDSRWENFRRECQGGLNEVYEQLCQDQGELCVYCELKVSKENRQVEHFHDKSDESDAANPTKWHLTWKNMWYACMGGTKQSGNTNEFMPPIENNRSCGQVKENEIFQNIIAPDEVSLLLRIFRYKQGADAVTIHPDEELCLQANVDVARVQRTIDALGLNCPRLCKARLSVLRPLNRRLNHRPDFQERVRLASHYLGDAQRQNRTSFFTMIRFILKDAAEEYLRSIEYNG